MGGGGNWPQDPNGGIDAPSLCGHFDQIARLMSFNCIQAELTAGMRKSQMASDS